jgi:hypothetical protein
MRVRCSILQHPSCMVDIMNQASDGRNGREFSSTCHQKYSSPCLVHTRAKCKLWLGKIEPKAG